jgi:hypothetical protein
VHLAHIMLPALLSNMPQRRTVGHTMRHVA